MKLSSIVSFEELAVIGGPSDVEVAQAETVLSETPDDIEVTVGENASEIIKLTDAGEVIVSNIARLETFNDEATRVLEAGVVTPDVVMAHVDGVNTILHAVGEEPLRNVSFESSGSHRVSLESAVASTKDRIKALRDFFVKLAEAIVEKLKKFWRDNISSTARFKAKATLVSKEAAKMNRDVVPKIPTVSFPARWLAHGGYDAGHVIAGIKQTTKNIKDFITEVEKVAKAHYDHVKALCDNAKGGSGPSTIMAWQWASSTMSGDLQIELDISGSMPVFRIVTTQQHHSKDIKPFLRDDITMLANEVRELAHELELFNKADDEIERIYRDQRKLFDDLIKHAIANPGTVPDSTIRRIGDATNKHFSNDLVRGQRTFRMIGDQALGFVVRSLRCY